jgi:hypothetical protein
MKTLLCYHDNIITLSWQGYHVIIISLSSYHDNVIIFSWQHVIFFSWKLHTLVEYCLLWITSIYCTVGKYAIQNCKNSQYNKTLRLNKNKVILYCCKQCHKSHLKRLEVSIGFNVYNLNFLDFEIDCHTIP